MKAHAPGTCPGAGAGAWQPHYCRVCWLAGGGDPKAPVAPRPLAARPGPVQSRRSISRPDCIHLGPALPDQAGCGCKEKLRRCDLHGVCTAHTPRVPLSHCCKTCEDYDAGGPEPLTLATFDEHSLAPGQSGKRFNSSLLRWGEGYILAYRDGWAGSEIHVATLSADLKPLAVKRLMLRHRQANYGREDPRLFLFRGRLHVSFIGVEQSRRLTRTSQLYAELTPGLDVAAVYAPELSARKLWEKNWAFFEAGDSLYAVYTIRPHSIIKIAGDKAERVYETPGLGWHSGEPRGGAPPVRVGDRFFHFFHARTENPRIYNYGLYTFDAEPPFAVRSVIPAPLLVADQATKPADQYCAAVFPCGAVLDGGRWLVSSGEHDRWTRIDAFDSAELDALLRPVV